MSLQSIAVGEWNGECMERVGDLRQFATQALLLTPSLTNNFRGGVFARQASRVWSPVNYEMCSSHSNTSSRVLKRELKRVRGSLMPVQSEAPRSRVSREQTGVRTIVGLLNPFEMPVALPILTWKSSFNPCQDCFGHKDGIG